MTNPHISAIFLWLSNC